MNSFKQIINSLLVFCLLVCMVDSFAREIVHTFVSPHISNSLVLSGFLDENEILLKGVIYRGFLSALNCVAIIFLIKEKWIKLMCYVMLFASCVFLLSPICSYAQNKTQDGLKKRDSIVYHGNVLAIRNYIQETKHLPSNLVDAILAIPAIQERNDTTIERCLNCRLTELFSGKTNIVREFDGSGGWVYNPESGIFGINVKGMEQYTTNLTTYLGDVRMKTEKMIKK